MNTSTPQNQMEMNKDITGIAAVVGLSSGLLFVWRYRQSQDKAKYLSDGKFLWWMFLLDLVLHVGLGLIGAVLTFKAFETPILAKYFEYAWIACAIAGITADRILPLIIDYVERWIERKMKKKPIIDSDNLE